MDDLLNQPALAPPPGVVSHFPDLSSSSQVIFYPIAIFVTTVPGVLFIIRIYTKLQIVGRLDVTDLVLFLAWPFFIALVVIGWAIAAAGGGAHQWNLRNADLLNMLYYCWLFDIVWAPCTFFIKATILLQYQRLFSPRRSLKPFMWWAATFLIAATAIFYCMGMFATLFACSPQAGAWNYLLVNVKCVKFTYSTITNYAFNIATDGVILLLPIKTVWQLQMSRQKRIGIMALFAPGILACISSGMVIYNFLKAFETADLSYHYRSVGCWALAELSFGFIVASAPLLPKFFNARFPSFTKHLSSFSRWLTYPSWARCFGGRRERGPDGQPVDGDGSAARKNKPVLPEIRHITTITMASKSGTTTGHEITSIDVADDVESDTSRV